MSVMMVFSILTQNIKNILPCTHAYMYFLNGILCSYSQLSTATLVLLSLHLLPVLKSLPPGNILLFLNMNTNNCNPMQCLIILALNETRRWWWKSIFPFLCRLHFFLNEGKTNSPYTDFAFRFTLLSFSAFVH